MLIIPPIRSRNEVYMETTKLTYQKHLDQGSRIFIEKSLEQSLSLRRIALSLGKDPSTIAKEIKKHRIFQEHNKFNETPFRCALAKDCKRTSVCHTELFCSRLCKRCPKCHSFCSDYTPFDYHCPKTDKAPYVCNACPARGHCRLDKFYYRAVPSHREYRTTLTQARTGINMSEIDLAALDSLVSPLIRSGHSPYMILKNHPEIPVCEKTLYNYISSCVLSVKNLDLPKKVKYKPRKAHSLIIDDSGIFEGRTYKDFLAFLDESPDTPITEMDTVVGPSGSKKVLLTLHFCSSAFMMAYLLDSKDSSQVEAVFDRINRAVSTSLFSKIMPLVLTDRGMEFRHPDALECSIENSLRTRLFYCDPLASWQKPHCERNHEYIRKICPQTVTTFDHLTQDDVVLMMSHINSACRQSLNGLTPFSLARLMLPKALLDFFGLYEIPADEVILSPALLNGKNKL